jgi:hypothetical protein
LIAKLKNGYCVNALNAQNFSGMNMQMGGSKKKQTLEEISDSNIDTETFFFRQKQNRQKKN